jgi:hypothetical protein
LGESSLHAFLKKIGKAFLLNQGCFLVDTEVALSRTESIHELDNHRVVDVLGVGERFFKARKETIDHYSRLQAEKLEIRKNILRCIEVKVFRSDFQNGFFSSGCNFNYLLTPMRLVSLWELPKGVGLIEYNKYKFSAELTEEERFAFKGLRVIKKASYKSIPQHQIDNAISQMVKRSQGIRQDALLIELIEGA